jgi:acetyl esterase/lipase
MCLLFYLQDPALLHHPLVSPTLLPDLTGLSRQGMLVVAGGAELMRPDIASFAAKAKAAGEKEEQMGLDTG